jgi:hypothetical protein
VLDGRYNLQSQGFAHDLGMLYHALDVEAARPVEILLLEPLAGWHDNLLEELMRVQRLVADLGRPGLVPYEQAGTVEGRPYLVRPQVTGRSLASVLAQSGSLGAQAVAEIAIDLCRVLAPAHQAGLVHGGLAPHCLFLPQEYPGDHESGLKVIITDLGLIPALRPGLATAGRPWGRKPYLSPEQAAGKRAQPASDVYVIGCLIYLMLAGRPPFRTEDERLLAMQHLRHAPASLQILVPGLPSELVQIVDQTLTKEPAGRYRNAAQLGHVLRSQIGAQPAPPSLVPAARSMPDVRAAQAPPGLPQAGERLVVAPPPRRPPVRRAHRFVEDRAAAAETGDIDWLMLGLLLAGLIAVLGLIPLWRTVYRRYSAEPPPPTPASCAPQPGELAMAVPAGYPGTRLKAVSQDPSPPAWPIAWKPDGNGAQGASVPPPGRELEDLDLFCYNRWSAGAAPGGEKSARSDPVVWESSLRDRRGNYSKLRVSQTPTCGRVGAGPVPRL